VLIAELAWDAASWMNDSLGDPKDVKGGLGCFSKNGKKAFGGFSSLWLLRSVIS